MINTLINYLVNTNNLKKINKLIFEKQKNIKCFGLNSDNEIFFYLSLRKITKGILFIVLEEAKINFIYHNLKQWLGDKIAILPKRQILPYKTYLQSKEIKNQRLKTIKKLIEGSLEILILTEESLMDKYISKKIFTSQFIFLKKGDKIDRELFIKSIVNLGYIKNSLTESEGTFSIRGDIIDFFDPTFSNPIRIEFFDDIIEKIKIFDKENQLTLTELDFIKIFTNNDFVLDLKELKHCKTKCFNNLNKSYNNNFCNFFKKLVSITEYSLEKPYMIFKEFDLLKEKQNNFIKKWDNLIDEGISKKIIYSCQRNFYFRENFERIYKNFFKIFIYSFCKNKLKENFNTFIFFKSQQIPFVFNKINKSIENIKNFLIKNQEIFIFLQTENKKNILKKIFKHNKINSKKINLIIGNLKENFKISEINLICINEQYIFGEKKQLNFKKNLTKRIDFKFNTIKEKDYVVHEDYGIAKYDGIISKKILGIKKDYLKLIFADTGKLFIPVNKSYLIEKYIGIGLKIPKLSNLHNKEWKKTKEKAKISANESAKELLKLYSKRSLLKGYRFNKDTKWQKTFEKFFKYEETTDQIKAINEVKKDMETDIPMDRILIGDVGYGKTEIALRAAFKATIESKQVAILCPTTVLSQQHYVTFLKRFESFPINIGLLNRFVSKFDQIKIVKKIQEGKIDVLIGTHRILSKDIVFKDLGLLIIDEEQKFGVKHKEKIKQLKNNIDCLTLSATPIPRTLYMALAKIKNLSIIETPPKERIPTQTYVLPYNLSIVRESILKEIERKGQIFYLYNKIKFIENKKNILEKFIPEASFSIAHGKMDKIKLEKNMLNFSNGKIDVLLCTTLIENGLNIKNANTLIIENTTELGLAQIYQIKGRVGRSNKTSFAYFMFNNKNRLSDKTIKYLKIIKEFTENGSGFKISMLDLEMRGAGNLLGKEQHGHILSVGFELYYKLLEDEINKIKGKNKKIETENKKNDLFLPINIDGYIPDNYIQNSNIKLEFYRKIYKVKNKSQLEHIKKELVDRFGLLPNVTKDLFYTIEIKLLSKILKIEKIKNNITNIMISLNKENYFLKKLKNMKKTEKKRIIYFVKNKIIIYYKIKNLDIKILLQFLKKLKNIIFESNV